MSGVPDGSAHRVLPGAVAARAPARPGGFTVAAVMAIALHAVVLLPFVRVTEHNPPPLVVEDLEVSPAPEAASPQPVDAASFAEPVATVPPEPVQAAVPLPVPVEASPPDQVQPPPPETVRVAAPPESVALPPPEPLQAETPSETVSAEVPELVEAVEPPQDTAEALPLPPPPAPPPLPPARAAPPSRPAPRPTPATSPRPVPPEAPAAEARAAAPASPAPPARPPPNYVGRLLTALDRHKEYPAAARRFRAEGTALLRFSMRRDGAVAAWRIERSSGHASLDDAVAQMIQRASPLPAPPAELPGDPVELVVPVRFSLR